MKRKEKKNQTNLGKLDIVDVQLAVILPKVERALAVLFSERICLVDLGIFRQLAVCLEISCLIGRVLHDYVGLVVLEFTEGEKDDVALIDPDLNDWKSRKYDFSRRRRKVVD